MRYQGKYRPSFPRKYKGDPSNVIYRSSWEYKFMKWCDITPSVQEWGSEEIIIPYISPWDNRRHRYFPDFYIKARQADGSLKKMIIEVKPKVQCSPPKEPKRKTRKYLNEVKTWSINEAKWKYATEWCKNNDMEFVIINEDHLGISYK